MAVKGKGKQIAGKALASSASTSSGKRKKVVSRGPGDRRRKRRAGVLQFFDDAAQDADFDEEEEDKEEEDDLDYEDEDLNTDFSMGVRSEGKEFRCAGKPQYLPFLVKEEELSGDELEELIKDRYGRASEYVEYDEDPKECDDGVSVEHSAEDQKIWRVKCMVGREQQMVLCLMHKYADLQRLGTKMEIISAFALEHVKGYVYIEADKACDIVEACKGFFNIYATRMGLVPSNEIPHLLSTRNKPCTISKGTWVRMKSGNYKGDLGQVVDYDDARKRATIKLVPRIDLQAIAKKYGGGVSLKEAGVPVPRLISSQELEHFRSHIEIRLDRHSGEYFEILDGLMLKDGYLYKKVSIASIVFWGVQPSKDELLKFTEMSKADEEDVSWLSSVYNVRQKMKSSEAADTKGASEQGNGFNLHDLVLFGRKGFGVIIDLGKDGIKILKGDTAGQEVMTIKSMDIKSRCVDKMFTASDRHRKTIYINDSVKVPEGPLEGREGTVRHMYKGTLFIYDENQEENSGMFCAKSDLCENVTPLKDSSFRKGGNKSSSSFNQSCEQEDSSLTFNRNRRSESNQPFSIGQTLRIRKGPLKGYLCRVVRIYRSDVTVKLDSLVKVITVEEQFLSIPNIKRDFAAEMPSDITGGLSGIGERTAGTSSWNGASSSWQALSTSTLFANNNDQKTEQEQEADPWGSKVSLAAGDHKQGADPWGSKSSIAAGDHGGSDPWDSKLEPAARDHEQGADPWGSNKSISAGDQGGTDPWGSKLVSVAREADIEQGGDAWGRNIAGASTDKEERADPWGGKTALGDSSQSDKAFDNWAKVSGTSGEQNSWNKSEGGGFEKDGDGWNRPFVKTTPPTTASGISSSDHKQGADPWGSKVSVAARDDKQGADPWGSKPSLPAEDQGADPWASKMAAGAREQEQGGDPCGKKMATTSRDEAPKADLWGSNATQCDSSCSGKALDSWEKIPIKGEKQNPSWNKTAGGVCEKDGDGWNKPSVKSSPGLSSGGNVASGWEMAAVGTKSAVEGGAEPSTWDKVKVSSDGQSGWDTAGWGKASPSTEIGTDDWKTKSSGGDQVSNWKKGGHEESWKSRVPDENQGSGWGKGSKWNDGANSHEGQDNDWNWQRDFDGGRGSSTGRGRGRFGGRRNGNEDNEDRSGDFGGGWVSGRGQGSGRYWGRGTGDEDNEHTPGDFGGGWVSGRGRGRGRFGGRRNGDENHDRSGDFGGGWESERGRGRGRYGGRGTGDEDYHYGQGGFGADWGSGRGRGRGQYWGRGTGDEDKDGQGGCGGGWRSARGRGRGQSGGSWGRGARDDDDQVRTGVFDGSWGSGKVSGQREQEQGADLWGSNVAGATDKEQNDGPWGCKAALGDSSHSDSWTKASCTIGEQNSAWNKASSGFSKADEKQVADPWGRKVSLPAEADQRGADPWGSKLAAGTKGQEEGTDTWGTNAAATSGGKVKSSSDGQWGSNAAPTSGDKEKRSDPWGSMTAPADASHSDKEKKADPWGSMTAPADTSHSDKALDSWGKASGAGGEQNSSWNNAAGGGLEKDGDGWNIPSVKSIPVAPGIGATSGGNAAPDWGSSAVGAKSTVEHGGESSSWDKVKSSSDGQSACWGEAGSSTKNVTDGWSNSKSFGGQVSDWMKGGDEDAWKSKQKDSWDKPNNFEGSGGYVGGRGRGRNSWDKPMDREGGQVSGWGRGSDWNGGASSCEGRDFDGGRGFGRGRGILGRYGGRGNRNDDSSGDFSGGWGSGRGRGGGWNGDSENDDFGRGRGGNGGRGSGRFQSSDWSY